MRKWVMATWEEHIKECGNLEREEGKIYDHLRCRMTICQKDVEVERELVCEETKCAQSVRRVWGGKVERKGVSKNERGGCEKGRAGLDYIWSQETPGSEIPMGIFQGAGLRVPDSFFCPPAFWRCLLVLALKSQSPGGGGGRGGVLYRDPFKKPCWPVSNLGQFSHWSLPLLCLFTCVLQSVKKNLKKLTDRIPMLLYKKVLALTT